MDWSGLLRDSWRTARRTPALWQLALVSASQVALYAVVIGGLIAPMSVLTQWLVQAQSPPGGAIPLADMTQTYLPALLVWLTRNGPLLVVGVLGITLLWALSGVLDVAAAAGSISQTSAAVEGRHASFAEGMRHGFGVWWRMVALLAIAAMPSLLYLLAIALFMLFAVSLPLFQGHTPDLALIGIGNATNSILSLVVGLVGIPLGVLVQLGVRFVVVEGLDWRGAWSSAWMLARARAVDVVLLYLLQLAVVSVATIAFSILVGVIVAAAGIAVALSVASVHHFSDSAITLASVAVVAVLVVSFAFAVLTLIWQSVVWTMFWRRITGRDPLGIRPSDALSADASVTSQGELR